jgi:hypothetical protein
MKNIGLINFATGKYTVFASGSYRSCDEHFFARQREFQVPYFLFTNVQTLAVQTERQFQKILITHVRGIIKPDLFSQIPEMDPEEALIPYGIFSEAGEILHPRPIISGGYWLARKKDMLEFPLDERLVWGEAKDIDWSVWIKKNT